MCTFLGSWRKIYSLVFNLLSLSRFRSVCKRWNTLFHEKIFIKNHLGRAIPQFIVVTNSKVYSIDIIGLDSIDPTMKLHDISSSDIPYVDLNFNSTTITTGDGLLCLNSRWLKNGTALWIALWNPWLRQVKWFRQAKWIEYEDAYFWVCGVGYDNSRPEKVYKIFGYLMWKCKVEKNHNQKVAIYECASHALKFIDTPEEDWPISGQLNHVSLNGNVYWLYLKSQAHKQFIQTIDFSRDILKTFCLLPCRMEFQDKLVLAVFKGDRFSLLKQCDVTKNIEIWVTKKKIDCNNSNGEKVVWINLMTLPTTNLPTLFNKFYGVSYFIYDKTLIMCCSDNDSKTTCIYIVRRDLFKKIQIGSGFWRCAHCVCAPNLIPVPVELRAHSD